MTRVGYWGGVSSIAFGVIGLTSNACEPSNLNFNLDLGDASLIESELRPTGDDYPSAVLLSDLCAGAKVGERQVLLAAHCVDAEFSVGNAVNAMHVSTVKGAQSANATEQRTLHIEKIDVAPTWAAHCPKGCASALAIGRNPIDDIAVITFGSGEVVPGRTVAIDLTPINTGDYVLATKTRCSTLDFSVPAAPRLLMEERNVLPFERAVHAGSFLSAADIASGLAASQAKFNFLTAGSGTTIAAESTARDAGAEAGTEPAPTPVEKIDVANGSALWPDCWGGIGGGPVYRRSGTGTVLVGIDSTSTYARPDIERTEQGITFAWGGEEPVTEWHARFDRSDVSEWLNSLNLSIAP